MCRPGRLPGETVAVAIGFDPGVHVTAAACIIELTFLEGRKRLPVPFESLVKY